MAAIPCLRCFPGLLFSLPNLNHRTNGQGLLKFVLLTGDARIVKALNNLYRIARPALFAGSCVRSCQAELVYGGVHAARSECMALDLCHYRRWACDRLLQRTARALWMGSHDIRLRADMARAVVEASNGRSAHTSDPAKLISFLDRKRGPLPSSC